MRTSDYVKYHTVQSWESIVFWDFILRDYMVYLDINRTFI